MFRQMINTLCCKKTALLLAGRQPIQRMCRGRRAVMQPKGTAFYHLQFQCMEDDLIVALVDMNLWLPCCRFEWEAYKQIRALLAAMP